MEITSKMTLLRTIKAAICLCLVSCFFTIGNCDSNVWVIGTMTNRQGEPIANGVVLAYNTNNTVAAWAKTDSEGEYALPVPQYLLHLQQPHGGGFLSQVIGGAEHLVGGAIDFFTSPLRAGVGAAASGVASTMVNPLAKGGIAAANIVLDQTLFAPEDHDKKQVPEQTRNLPGALLIKAIAPNCADLTAVARIYWLQDNLAEVNGKTLKARVAWLDPLTMASVNSDHASHVSGDYLTFKSARLVPSIAQAGDSVQIFAQISFPSSPETPIVVVARNVRTGKIWRLHSEGDGFYERDIQIDRSFPLNDQSISILAYAADTKHPGRRKNVEGAILHSGLWDPLKPYRYEPLLVASRNRADLTLTILPAPKHR